MPITKQRTLDYITIEWKTYIERFNSLSKAEQEKRVASTGYTRFRDILAHVLAWWEEGMPILSALAENREYERKKYDYDAFNAEAVAKYADWDEAAFLARFEEVRQEAEAGIRSMNEAAFENRRIKSWANGIFIHHAREHLMVLSRFMVVDLLKNEWATYAQAFTAMDATKQTEFLAKQGVASFHDMQAHIVGWWEEGARIISGIVSTPGFTWQSLDTDAYNIELTKKYASWSDADMNAHYESVRQAMIELTLNLPDTALSNPDIEGWLKDDVVGHYDDHPL